MYGKGFPDNCQKSSVSLCKNSSHGFALPHVPLPHSDSRSLVVTFIGDTFPSIVASVLGHLGGWGSLGWGTRPLEKLYDYWQNNVKYSHSTFHNGHEGAMRRADPNIALQQKERGWIIF